MEKLSFSIVTLLNDFCAMKRKKPKQLACRVPFIFTNIVYEVLLFDWPILAVQNALDSCQYNLTQITILDRLRTPLALNNSSLVLHFKLSLNR